MGQGETTGRRRFWTRAAAVTATAIVSMATIGAGTAEARYVYVEDDFVNGRTAQAEHAGSFTTGGASAGLVRWHYDDNNGVKRGEFRSSSIVRARAGHNPVCIAARVRWQTLSASPSFSLPPSVSVGIGLETRSDGWYTSCRSATSTRPPAPIVMTGVNHASRAMLRVHADVCHRASSNAMWVCATDTNAYGGE